MTIWITGASGFLGSRITAALRGEGRDVVAISRRTADVKAISLDLASDGATERLVRLAVDRPPDTVIHMAARQPGKFPVAAFVRSNVLSTATLLDALAPKPPQRIIYTSTLSVYGKPEANPVGESDATRASGAYAVTKLATEQLLADWSRSAVTILRLPSLFGAGQSDSFIDGICSSLRRNDAVILFSRGELLREALWVGEAVGAIVSAIDRRQDQPLDIMNLGRGQRLSVRDYVETLKAVSGSASEITLADTPSPAPSLHADVSRARQRIGFAPHSLEDAMRRYIDELSV